VIQLFFVVVSGDWLAAQAMGFTPESTSAEFPCGECMWVSFAAARRQRARIAGGATAAADSSVPPEPEPALRTHAKLVANAASLIQQNLAKTVHKAQLKALGMNKVRCVLQYLPGADTVLDKPPDSMHLYGCGLSRIEGAWKLRVLFKEGAGLAVSDAWNRLRANIGKFNQILPRGKHISLLYPQSKDKKINQMHLDLNASETFLYVNHSVTLVEPLLTESGKKDPAWLSWLAHRKVVMKTLQHSITDKEVDPACKRSARRLSPRMQALTTAPLPLACKRHPFHPPPNDANIELVLRRLGRVYSHRTSTYRPAQLVAPQTLRVAERGPSGRLS
jgi:hypothetical protein